MFKLQILSMNLFTYYTSILSRKLTIWRTLGLGLAQPCIHWDLPSEPEYVYELPNQSIDSVSSRLKTDPDRYQWSQCSGYLGYSQEEKT